MTRREIRERLFELLFLVEFYKKDQGTVEEIETFFEEHEMSEKDEKELRDKVAIITEKLPEIDEIIANNSKGWKINRIGKEELAILRLALYEIRYDEEVPDGVAINEAVELGKKYGAEGGASFINGLLGNVVNG
ncbi:transcription antitermination factor NusB [Eubacterium xylanophilum]|uniref:transcription antitermination factor NusB n=1 Tax=Eubacterium xylanophilum TaxID=39497 RepID=UPI00047A3E30|nr:transcription antitermination factor NusB [Eubacterium xylanophilum]MCR5796335.1 transcription antitermination factor NusB [Eubacterium sp.]